MLRVVLLVVSVSWLLGDSYARADEALRSEARTAMTRAVKFFASDVAVHGGYVYRYSDDLRKREGEGIAAPETVWVQPPGTPFVGQSFLDAYLRTGDASLLDAAKSAGHCLVRGQLHSGGWQAHIDFGADLRGKQAYRVEPLRAKARNLSTFDDNKTQSALTALIRLDAALGFKDDKIHEAALFALQSILRVQFPNGGWAQVFEETPDPAKHPVKRANYPESWPREYPGGPYWFWYTFNDNAIADTIDVLLLAARTYKEPRYRDAALKAGDFIILAQMPEPQPAWAQQYNFEMQPVWARKFEPPAITAGESQGVIEILLRLYVESGDRKVLEPIPAALGYLERSKLSDGRLARFYELRTNKPLYFTKDYRLTEDDGDVPTHYGFKVGSKLDSLRKRFGEIQALKPEKLASKRESRYVLSTNRPSDDQVRSVIKSLDSRGAWVESGSLKYHGKNDDTRRVIDSETFVKNLDVLSRYVGAEK